QSLLSLTIFDSSFSFGYDCTRRVNLQLLDEQTIMYVAGNLVVLVNIKTKEHKYVRSSSGGGIGIVHPSRMYFAIGEKGLKPNIIIYEYPTLLPYRVLREGTEQAYAFTDFNLSGTLLASIGSNPDYMLTIWNWKQEQIILRSKAFSQDVFRVTFSPENEEQLTTSGTGHIKFWKMAQTFTGLKLQGQLGRFGKTALTDIEGYVELPDGKVVSGSEWGNMLLWEGGLIKIELCRKDRKPCHSGSINQFVLDEGELITIGSDGCVRVWDFETIDTADTANDDHILEMEPMNELIVGKNVNLHYMVKINNENSFWFAQDANGGIWKLDLSFTNITQDPESIFSFHAGSIQGMDLSPLTHLMATTALDRTVRIYDFVGKQVLTSIKFKQGGTALKWAPLSVSAKGDIIVVGFEDGVLRILEVYNPKGLAFVAGRTKIGLAEIRLKQALKPHVANVTEISFSQQGDKVATGSIDKTVFIFTVGNKFEPIGFINVPGTVVIIEWIQSPHVCNKREELLKALQESGEEISEEDLPEEEPEEEEELPPIYIPEEPSPILCGFHSQPGTFWLSLGGYDAGYLYQCKFSSQQNIETEQEPFHYLAVENSDENPIRKITKKQLLFCGMQNGSVRIYPLLPHDLNLVSMKAYWSLSVHDNDCGYIQQIITSYNSEFLVTCGNDGNIFVFNLLLQVDNAQFLEGKRADVPFPRVSIVKAAEDIDDPNAYSIENAKQKAEHDLMVKLAEEEKADKRIKLATLCKEFKALQSRNAALPEHVQLNREDFELDHRIRLETERQTIERIGLVSKETAWEQEKHLIGLRKLQARFRDAVEFDTVVIHAIESDHQVSTYRVKSLSDKYYLLRNEMKKKQSQMQVGQKSKEDLAKEIREAGRMLPGIIPNIKKLQKIIEKAEKAKAKIEMRRKQWEDLFASKPDEDYEDPKDVAAIKEAKENMGDFKLKTAPNYTVPEHLRMNAEKKRNQLIILEQKACKQRHSYELKVEMNKKVMKLRDAKLDTVKQISSLVEELKLLQKKLEPSKHLPIPEIPKLYLEETPEKKFEYDKETLLNFKGEITDTQQRVHSEMAGGYSLATKEKKDESSTPEENKSKKREVLKFPIAATKLETELKKIEETKHLYFQTKLLDKISQLIKYLDAELRVICHQKCKLDINMKMADLLHVTLFEEVLLLKEFEKRENVLQERVNQRINDRLETQVKRKIECLLQLEAKKRDITKLHEKEKALYMTFQLSLGENNKHIEFLTKVFKKKIKRAKKKEAQLDEDDEEESDEESEEQFGMSSDEDESDSEMSGLDDTVCPENCDPSLFDNTIQLREVRLDIEELLAEEKKVTDQMKKEYDSIAKKIKVIEGTLQAAEADLELLQREKQQKLNELHVVVPLKLHQMEYIVNGEIPNDLVQALVFTNEALLSLQQRIRELQQEKAEQRELYKQARQKHVQLIRDRKDMEAKIAKLEETCYQEMILKFGRVVDLEALQTLSVNKILEELRDKVQTYETEFFKDLKRRESTCKLDQMNALVTRKKEIEGHLDVQQRNLGAQFQEKQTADLEERQRMIQLVDLQAQEIEALKDEISLLSRKGGHILPPTQPPLIYMQEQKVTQST
uniref:Cilia- and flagella-associated protein 44 n=1 Tax=Callorhinchus milii TaxID=7868 RepID=A0A4W3IB69_CALMI